MKNAILMVILFAVVSACGSLGPDQNYYTGMKERKFLRQNKEVVVSSLDGPLKTYRVNRDERFYILATFENERLTKLEEREIRPLWMDGRSTQDTVRVR
jgi:hypothetical protein